MMFIPLLLFIMLFYFLFRDHGFTRDQISQPKERSPLDILNQRYAEGSLSQDEYLRMREELNKNN